MFSAAAGFSDFHADIPKGGRHPALEYVIDPLVLYHYFSGNEGAKIRNIIILVVLRKPIFPDERGQVSTFSF